MDSEAGTGNGRIMVAQADIQNLSDRLAEFTTEVRTWMRETDQRNLANSMTLAAQASEIQSLRREVEALKVKSDKWDLINSIAAALALLLAYLTGAP